MSAHLYRRINELTTENRQLKAANQELREKQEKYEGATLYVVSGNPLDGLVGFIGSGENSRGQFPTSLTELNADCCEFNAARAVR